MIVCLGFSHIDHWLAVRWLRWVSWLCMKDGGDSSPMTLVIFGTKRITPDQWSDLHRLHYRSQCMFNLEPVVCRDEKEVGYPGCATHLFFRALEYCEQRHAGSPVLWVEPDTVPLRAAWAQEIEAEYVTEAKPFLGARSGALCQHMPGVAVYPHDWRAKSPCLANALSLPDIPLWGKGKSQAWDTACASDIVPQMALSKTIHQVWRPRHIDSLLLSGIPKTAALFHQDKHQAMPMLIDPRFH
jgi:hypothetical protein